MNDFNKEELQIIRFLINNTKNYLLTSVKEFVEVQSKIQCMIDSYCDEDIENMCDHETDAPRQYNCNVCIKCGEEY